MNFGIICSTKKLQNRDLSTIVVMMEWKVMPLYSVDSTTTISI